MRFVLLGEVPPGLYRDEAYNGLDAVDVLAGDRQGLSPLYFATNNGREPVYIYLTALSIKLLGPSAQAVRLAAAVIGTLTTWFTYKLATTWFNQRVGLLSAWIWAITFWSIHLSRVGFRAILLPLMLAMAFWLGALAYHRTMAGKVTPWLWLLAGAAYGASFYTYLAVRFTPIFLALFILYLVLTGHKHLLWPGLGWALLGTMTVTAPLAMLAFNEPELILGRLGQVSIFDANVNQGNILKALWQNSWRALGLFVVQGDTIPRHNLPGRPVFDLFMALPFVTGLLWCLRNWRKQSAIALLLWTTVMLGPTILAEDTPHFLRAAGVLPAIMIFPAIGLSLLWTWTTLPSRWRQLLVIMLLFASTLSTITAYFFDYGRDATITYWFEAAASDLAKNMNSELDRTEVFSDRRFYEGWPSIRFLLENEKKVSWYTPDSLLIGQIEAPATVYAWPYERLDMVAGSIKMPALVSGETGALAKGDLEPEPYPLYVYYQVENPVNRPTLANFDNAIQLHDAEVTQPGPDQVAVTLYWSAGRQVEQSLVTFVHVNSPTGLIAQSDGVPGQGYWPVRWWRPGLIIKDKHTVSLPEEYENTRQQIVIGVYDANTRVNLPIVSGDGDIIGDTWLLQP